MTEYDKLFLDAVNRAAEVNAKAGPGQKKAVVTSQAFISDDLIKLYGLSNQGGFIGNVYIVFRPLFQEIPAEDWQER